ncbi:Ig-like domain-containing protein [Brachybacterium endophyticum]|uniref:Ig-like domain-containing protein n=1 Tax=Brachybacterium endophyticum TaxID=2182385 RepID=UPI001057A099|nr:hypothetical protein [Brachybacterium endophyticum]
MPGTDATPPPTRAARVALPRPVPHRERPDRTAPPDESPRRTAALRSASRRSLRLGLVLVLGLMISLVSPSAALALGEKGPFELPLSRDSITVAPGVVNRVPLSSLLEDGAEDQLQLDTARLAVPSEASGSQLDAMTLASDGSSLSVEGQGTWTVQGESLVYTPASDSDGSDPAPIAITVEATNGVRSHAVDLEVDPSAVTEKDVTAPAGTTVSLPLNGKLVPEGTARIRLLLDTMPAGSSLSGDGRRLFVADEGIWQLSPDNSSLTFIPSSGHLGRSPEPARFVTESKDGSILSTGVVGLSTPVLTDMVRASAYGDPVDFAVGEDQEDVDASTLRLVPLESIKTSDGSDASGSDGGSGSGSDSGSATGEQGGQEQAGGDQGSGQDADDAGDGATTSDGGAAGDGAKGSGAVTVTDDGTRAKVAGQGTWTLDRSDQRVRFTPEDDGVTEADPIGVTGRDDDGNTAGVATLSPGYPAMLDQTEVGAGGNTIGFDPMDASHYVQADSLRFSDKDLPDGAELDDSGRELRIPDQGTWEIDVDSRLVTFDPVQGARNGLRSQVSLTGSGSYADDTTATSTLTALVSDTGAVLRDDDLRTAPGRTVQVDLLANDTAGATTAPLAPATVRISALDAANLDELDRYSGTHLVVPGEGEYRVGSDGVLTFVPADGFRGRTSPVDYTVEDDDGVRYRATVTVHVDPQLASSSGPRADSSAGINTMLSGLMPSSRSTSAVFLTIVVLIGFAGVMSLFIGSRMESDRRTWKD